MLFSVVNLGRFLGAEPETALTAASNKFISRFEIMEQLAVANGKDMSQMTISELDELWNCAKQQ